jgi:hypothetical protein
MATPVDFRKLHLSSESEELIELTLAGLVEPSSFTGLVAVADRVSAHILDNGMLELTFVVKGKMLSLLLFPDPFPDSSSEPPWRVDP